MIRSMVHAEAFGEKHSVPFQLTETVEPDSLAWGALLALMEVGRCFAEY